MKEKTYHLGVKALIQNESGDILLLQGNPKKFTNAHWDIPGGRVLEHESIEETLLREVQEEIGPEPLTILAPFETLVSNIEIPLHTGQKAGLILHIYCCLLPERVFITLSEEHSDHMWGHPHDAAALLTYKYPISFAEKVRQLVPLRKTA